MTTVGLFGFYNYGNFGDDLMALLFSKTLKAANYRVITCACRPSLAAECQIDLVENIQTMVREADVIIYGGGGILVPHMLTSDSEYSNYRRLLHELLLESAEKNKPFAAFSIGGTGGMHDSLPDQVKLLLKPGTMSQCTLRLYGDRVHFEEPGAYCAVYPDVVLHTSSLFPADEKVEKDFDKKLVIGLNLAQRDLDHDLCRFLRAFKSLRKNVELVFIDTFDERSPVRSNEMRSRNPAENVPYTSLANHLQKLARLDMLVTHKLHLGVAALSYDIPTVSWSGPAKCRSFMAQVGAGKAAIGSSRKEFLLFCMRMLSAGGRCPPAYRPNLEDLKGEKNRSAQHMFTMIDWISNST